MLLQNIDEEFIFEPVSISDPEFQELKITKSIIRRVLKNKTLCLSSHKPHIVRYKQCPDCGAPTTINYSEYLKKLIDSPINSLRVGIPGSKYKNRDDSIQGILKMYMNIQKAGLFAGYVDINDEPNIYPIALWDLEKLQLIGVNLWNILYSLEGQLGTFIWMNYANDIFNIPPELKAYFDQPLFQFIGHHIISNKKILILSPNENFTNPLFSDLKKISGVIKSRKKFLNFDKILFKTDLYDEFKSVDWFLFFNNNEDIFIIPQTKSVLDIRDKKDLYRFLKFDSIAKNYKQKDSWKEWDMDEA